MADQALQLRSLDKSRDLLLFLMDVAFDSALGVISLDWIGCPACGGESPYITMRNSLPARYQDRNIKIHYGYCNWRKSTTDDLSEVVSRSYQLMLHLTRAKTQFFGGGKSVETFTDLDNPNYWRPKFPQLFFIDGSMIDQAVISNIMQMLGENKLFYPWEGNLRSNSLDNYLPFEVDEMVHNGPRVMSGDLQLDKAEVREPLAKCLDKHRAILLQLTNYHLYRADGDNDQDFVEAESLESCDCVVDKFEHRPIDPETCFRFDRREYAAAGAELAKA